MKNGKVWEWIYHHPKLFFTIVIFLMVVLTLVLGYTLDNSLSPAHRQLIDTLQVIQTQIATKGSP